MYACTVFTMSFYGIHCTYCGTRTPPSLRKARVLTSDLGLDMDNPSKSWMIKATLLFSGVLLQSQVNVTNWHLQRGCYDALNNAMLELATCSHYCEVMPTCF